MSTSTIRPDDGVCGETTRIAAGMGLSFNEVMNIMARKFNTDAARGSPRLLVRVADMTRIVDNPGDEPLLACGVESQTVGIRDNDVWSKTDILRLLAGE